MDVSCTLETGTEDATCLEDDGDSVDPKSRESVEIASADSITGLAKPFSPHLALVEGADRRRKQEGSGFEIAAPVELIPPSFGDAGSG